MRWQEIFLVSLTTVLLSAGCRTATRVTHYPRVDLALEGGNRGYLMGTPMESGTWKTTREMVETDIEIPSFYRPKRTHNPLSLENIAPPEMDMSEETPTPIAAEGTYSTYLVQKGDSLWSIAAKPEIYGKATQWRRIFEANRDLLKSPDQLRAGMTLRIHRTEQQPSDSEPLTYSDEDVSYRK